MWKKQIKLILFLALTVSVGIFILLSSYLFNFRRVGTLIKSKTPLLHAKTTNSNEFADKYSNVDKLKDNNDSVIIIERKKFADYVIKSIQDHEYPKIYSEASSRLKDLGSEAKFTEYMISNEKSCGSLSDIKLQDYSTSKDGLEVKLDYTAYSSKLNKKIQIIIWTRTEGQLKLSGLKYSLT